MDYRNNKLRKLREKYHEKSNLNSYGRDNDRKAYVNLPYISGTSNILRRMFNEHNIKSTFTSKETLRKILSHPKDKLSQENKSNVVYQIPCNECATSAKRKEH